MNEFENGELFPIGGIHQASKMYLADAAELGRFDAGRLRTLEKEWQAAYSVLPRNEAPFSFATALMKFDGQNGRLTFIYSPSADAFVLLTFTLKPSTRGSGNVVTIDAGLSHRPKPPVLTEATPGIAVGAVAFAGAADADVMGRLEAFNVPVLQFLAKEQAERQANVRAFVSAATTNAAFVFAAEDGRVKQLVEQCELMDAEMRLSEDRTWNAMAAQVRAHYVTQMALRRSRALRAWLLGAAATILIGAVMMTDEGELAPVVLGTAGVLGGASALAALRATGRLPLRRLADSWGLTSGLRAVRSLLSARIHVV
ncbi:hypothetical protein AEAC466_15015 [Asticcacaulis sp. AC466]|uniref:hypothetical protein n=1 Tax=Asticcacaulis sp. AC466 TaxID=1282362 RepID=UPI0003C3C512|nr:hypothetical protein [Asticcacaulis sp. AC466]ESQ83170.1 hypothetical protein AEAC466_15015 [Asticcacaulis sp. AC466]